MEDRKRWTWWKVKKWVLHIAHRLFSRYGDVSVAKEGLDRAFAAQFDEQYSIKFLTAEMELLRQYAQVRIWATDLCLGLN